ncbi:hypothetical protein [Olsenella massiliensis]|uniref:hypothetical protein n=1 Tax=Olsenella massiliensis TaxID=1622075 RepID=UPI00071D5F1E|nr:hypothetical protein [Olsenella massiliensis]
MRNLMGMELRKALRNPWLAIALTIALGLAVASAAGNIIYFLDNPIALYPHKFIPFTIGNCFKYWVSLDFIQPSSTLLFQLMPVLAVIPYAWSYRSELQSGYANQLMSRDRRERVLAAKALAVFVSGALVAVIPLVVNFLLLACFIPAYLPDVVGVLYNAVYSQDLWAWFFYNLPVVYVVLFTLLAGVLSGLWATFVHALSFVVENRVVLLIAPQLGLLGLQFVNDKIYYALGTICGVQLGLGQNMRAIAETYLQSPQVIFGEGALMLLVALVMTMCQVRRDVL